MPFCQNFHMNYAGTQFSIFGFGRTLSWVFLKTALDTQGHFNSHRGATLGAIGLSPPGNDYGPSFVLSPEFVEGSKHERENSQVTAVF